MVIIVVVNFLFKAQTKHVASVVQKKIKLKEKRCKKNCEIFALLFNSGFDANEMENEPILIAWEQVQLQRQKEKNTKQPSLFFSPRMDVKWTLYGVLYAKYTCAHRNENNQILKIESKKKKKHKIKNQKHEKRRKKKENLSKEWKTEKLNGRECEMKQER